MSRERRKEDRQKAKPLLESVTKRLITNSVIGSYLEKELMDLELARKIIYDPEFNKERNFAFELHYLYFLCYQIRKEDWESDIKNATKSLRHLILSFFEELIFINHTLWSWSRWTSCINGLG